MRQGTRNAAVVYGVNGAVDVRITTEDWLAGYGPVPESRSVTSNWDLRRSIAGRKDPR